MLASRALARSISSPARDQVLRPLAYGKLVRKVGRDHVKREHQARDETSGEASISGEPADEASVHKHKTFSKSQVSLVRYYDPNNELFLFNDLSRVPPSRVTKRMSQQIEELDNDASQDAHAQEVVSRLLADGEDVPELEELDEWDTISALEQNRRNLDWREQLKRPEDWEIESDLDNVGDRQELRLVHAHGSDVELWEVLYIYRLNNHGADGAKVIWKHLNWAAARHPMRVWERPRLWKGLLQVAFDDHQVLNDLISHCARMAAEFNDRPDSFYTDVMVHIMSTDRGSALSWHEALKGAFQPRKEEVEKLVNCLCKDPESWQQFASFCFELQGFTGMYGLVLNQLSIHKRYDQAVEWHGLLLKHGDVPSDYRPVEHLFKHLRRNNNQSLIHKMASELNDAGVPGGRQWLRTPVFDDPKKHDKSTGVGAGADSGNNLPAEVNFHNLPEKQLSDDFVARLIATSFFAVKTVLNGLSAINMTEIGPLGFRELLLRVAKSEGNGTVLPSHIAVARNLLQATQIGIQASTFSHLVEQLAADQDVELLQSVIESDQHPEVLDDLSLQESLLARYVEQGAETDVRRTLAILKITHGQNYSYTRATDIANLQLMQAIARHDKNAALSVLEGIISSHGSLSSNGLSGLLYEIMFAPRRRGSAPASFAELDTVSVFMKTLQRRGYMVPMKAWIELIRRRMWQVRLYEVKALLVWQYRWVNDPQFRLSLLLPNAKPGDWAVRYRRWSAAMEHGKSYNEAFLSLKMQLSVVQLGFVAEFSTRQSAIISGAAEVLAGSHEDKVKLLVKDKSLWGIRLLVQLRDLGARFDTDDIRKACAASLAVLFGPRLPKKAVHRKMQMGRKANWVDYAAAMESIWGEQLFMLPTYWTSPETGAKCWRREVSASPTRLQDYAKLTLKRAVLRSRLLRRGYWRAPDGVQGLGSRAMNHEHYWMRALPPVDTDAYLETLSPELNPSGKLEKDPLLDLTDEEVKSLVRGVNLMDRDTSVAGHVKEDVKEPADYVFEPWALEDKVTPQRRTKEHVGR